ncbi:MAG: sugar transferase EpsL [Thermodesulfobacteriota bacterium]|nr:sugar transferase EpsL [Thermodesulfobacteriota bacterium]
MKRLFDFIAALIALLLLGPVILVISLFVRVNMGMPVFFRQKRPGLHGKPFHIYKFRTMSVAYGEDGLLLPDRKRITKLGAFIRKWSLDELPQLFNILKGEMSLVGPRPLLMEYLPLYTPDQARRHDVKPGITGWAQVNGRNALNWNERFKLDVWYVDHHSFNLDMKIIFLTIWKILKREGINQPGQSTMEEFKGDK